MIQFWVYDKVKRLRNRFDHHAEMSSEQSTSTASTSSRSPSIRERRGTRLTAERTEAVIRIIKERMTHTFEDYAPEGTPHWMLCSFCMKRKGRFSGDICLAHGLLCKHCCYEMMNTALQNYTEGPLFARCPHCFRNISTLTRRKRRPTNEGQDENSPHPRQSERSISLYDYTESLLQEDGCVNKGFESSSSQ